MTQIDFLDQLGRELDGAACRVIRGRRRSRGRALLVPAAAMAVAAAVAVTVWPLTPADPEREVAAPAQTRSLSEMLAVLRRPETEADTGPQTRAAREALAQYVGGEAIFRLVATTPRGNGVVLAAAERVTFPGLAGDAPGACLHHPDVEHGVGCWSAEDIARGRAYLGVGDDLHGLAPDGATFATVSVQDDDLRTTVRDNYFALVDEYEGSDEIVAVVFRDDQEQVVTQHLGERGLDGRLAPVPAETLEKARVLASAPAPQPTGHPVGPAAAELDAVAAEIAGIIPYPPGFTVDPGWRLAPGAPQDMAAIEQRYDVQAILEFRAQCTWQRYWLAATQAGEAEIAAQAAQVLETVPRWPTLRSQDDKHGVTAFEVDNALAAAVARRVARACSWVPSTPAP